MLCVTRKPGQTIVLNDGTTIVVTKIVRGAVSIGVIAPPNVLVLRGELVEPKDGGSD